MKKIGIGYEEYKEFIDQNLYFIDKTMLVQEILEKGGKATLITRPRRFGKTLALSMLQTFFELEYDQNGHEIDKHRYFEGMKIMSAGEEILSKMGAYPVIRLSLKSTRQPDFYSAFMILRREMIDEYRRHDYLCASTVLSTEEKQEFESYLSGIVDWERKERGLQTEEERKEAFRRETEKYATALKTLSKYLKKHHGQNVIMLLDEYDVPLENAWSAGFYQEMTGFIRSLFESALKTNGSLEFAVITGCLRISRESIFTGMNHLTSISVRSGNFAKGFGFTQREMEQFLAEYDLSDKAGEVGEWYDGYLFGDTEIYNPWSVSRYVYDHLSIRTAIPEPYWSNTSSNSIIKEMVIRSDEKVKEELDILISGGTIEKRIHEDITYADIYESEDNLWNFLFFTGYMKKVSERQDGEDAFMTMKIPNREVRSIYRTQIRSWFDKLVEKEDRTALYQAVREKNAEEIGAILTGLLKRSISTFDSEEGFYHGYLLSMLIGMPDYAARSNREEGDGRPDIVLYPENPMDPAYLFECKVRKKFNQMSEGLEEAFDQIRNRRYEEGILDDGYARVISFGICFCRKSCIVGLLT